MCDPLVIAGIALSGASAAANAAAQGKVQRARDDALAAERIRQAGFDRETDALNAQSQDRYQNFDQQQDAKSSELGDYFGEQTIAPDTANASVAMPVSSSNITVQEENRQRGQARAFTDEQGNRLGELRAFGDVLGGIGRLQARDASKIGQIGGFKRGSSSVLPMELEEANQAGNKMRFLGDLVGGAGSLALSGGLGGAGGDTVANSLELKFGADPWRGLRSPSASAGTAGPVRLGKLY